MSSPVTRSLFRRALRLEAMESRVVPATYRVPDGVLNQQVVLTTTSDVFLGGLIDSINAANATPGDDTIDLFDGGHYEFLTANVNNSTSALPDITASSGKLTIQADHSIFSRDTDGATFFRFLTVAGGNLVVNELTFLGGDSGTNAGGAVNISTGKATFNSCFFAANSANNGGAVNNASGAGALTINDCWFNGNTATKDGGAVNSSNTVTIKNSRFDNNVAINGSGGAIIASKAITIESSSVSSNQALKGNGGGIAVENSTLTLTKSTIHGNSAINGGGINISQTAPGSKLESVTVTSNASTGSGGGINVTSNSFELGNSAFFNNTGKVSNDIQATTINTNDFNFFTSTIGLNFNNPHPNDKMASDPMLAELGNFGGVALSRPPLQGSLLVGKGNPGIGSMEIGAFDAARLKLNLTLEPGTVNGKVTPGTNTTYRIRLKNMSTTSVTGLKLQETTKSLTESWVASSSAGASTLTGTGNINRTLDLAAQESVLFVINERVNPSAVTDNTDKLTSKAILTPPPGFIIDLDNDSKYVRERSLEQTTTIKVNTAIAIASKSTAIAGGTFTYTIDVTNSGPSTAVFSLNSAIPANATAISWTLVGSGGATPSSRFGSMAIAIESINIPPSTGKVTITVTAKIPSSATGSIAPTASITIGQSADNPGSTSIALNPGEPIITGQVPFFVVASEAGTEDRIRVINAFTGVEITNFLAYGGNVKNGVRVALGDVNGDGSIDIVTGVGAGAAPHVKIFSGAGLTAGNTPPMLSEFFAFAPSAVGGVYVAVGNVDGDSSSKGEVIVGAGPGGGPHVRVFNAMTKEPLFKNGTSDGFYAYDAGFRGGVRVAAADFDGDGKADIVTGAGPGGGPHVRIINGANRSELKSFFAFDKSYTGGVFVAAGDVSGDSKPEIVLGQGDNGGSMFKIRSYASGVETIIPAYDLPSDWSAGLRVAVVADANGDGKLDILVGPGPGKGKDAKPKLFKGSDGTLIHELTTPFLGGVYVG